jgi:hypothetical protein
MDSLNSYDEVGNDPTNLRNTLSDPYRGLINKMSFNPANSLWCHFNIIDLINHSNIILIFPKLLVSRPSMEILEFEQVLSITTTDTFLYGTIINVVKQASVLCVVENYQYVVEDNILYLKLGIVLPKLNLLDTPPIYVFKHNLSNMKFIIGRTNDDSPLTRFIRPHNSNNNSKYTINLSFSLKCPNYEFINWPLDAIKAAHLRREYIDNLGNIIINPKPAMPTRHMVKDNLPLTKVKRKALVGTMLSDRHNTKGKRSPKLIHHVNSTGTMEYYEDNIRDFFIAEFEKGSTSKKPS